MLGRATRYLQTRGPHFILPVLTVLALQVDIFGLGAATQAQSEQSIVRLTAPLYGAPKQKSVVAVLIDKPYVELPGKGSGGSPIPYRKFTAVIDRLLPLDPAAIFINALFTLQSSDDRTDLDNLLQILGEAAKRGIPILLPMRTKMTSGGDDSTCALLDGSSSIEFDEKSVLPALLEWASKSQGDIRFVAANWHGCLTRYPLMLDKKGKVPSAALVLARKARRCESDGECEPYSTPMLIRWSAFPTPERFSFGSPCTPIQDPKLRRPGALLWNDIRQTVMQSRESEALRGGFLKCHYIDEVLASNLMNHHALSADFIRGRIVLIGTAPSMTQNWIRTPTNGDVPDVIVHAAATENLLSLGESYTRDMDSRSSLLLQLAVAVIVAAASLAIVARRKSTDWSARPAVTWWGLGICFALVLTVLLCDLPPQREALLIIVPLAAAWLLHARAVTLTTLAFFVIGAAMMVIFLSRGVVPLNWIGVLLAGLTAVVGAEFANPEKTNVT